MRTSWLVSSWEFVCSAAASLKALVYIDCCFFQSKKCCNCGSFPASVFTGAVQPMANGLAGASFSDSRFSPEYYTLGNQRVGTLFMSHSTATVPGWYYCTASVINRALLVTAAHCLCQQEKGVGDKCLPDVVNGTLQVGGVAGGGPDHGGCCKQPAARHGLRPQCVEQSVASTALSVAVAAVEMLQPGISRLTEQTQSLLHHECRTVRQSKGAGGAGAKLLFQGSHASCIACSHCMRASTLKHGTSCHVSGTIHLHR
jgi:hypothetical protein